MAGYVYKGTEPWTPRTDGVIEEAIPRPPAPRPKKPRKSRAKTTSKVPPFICGTVRAYAKHIRDKERPDAKCKAASATKRRADYIAKKAAKQ